MNFIELFGARYCGCSLTNSAVTIPGSVFRSDRWQSGAPFTVGHKLGIVSIHSYTARLKPSRKMESVKEYMTRTLKFTVDFLIVVQVSERVEVHIAMKRHMRPIDALGMSVTVAILKDILNAPIPSVGEDQLLLVKRSRLESAHISVPNKTVSGLRLSIRMRHYIRYLSERLELQGSTWNIAV